MKNSLMKHSVLVILAAGTLFGSSASEAYAWGWQGREYRGHDRYSHGQRYEAVAVGRDRYHYRGGLFYHWGLFGYVPVRAPVGAVVTVLPFGHTTVVVGGARYYYYDNVYYASCPSGYMVVAPPAAPVAAAGDAVVINVPNANGGYTGVRLTRTSNGYIGPQGEFYLGRPTVEQLKALYGN